MLKRCRIIDYITALKQNINPTLSDIDLKAICHAFEIEFSQGIFFLETGHSSYRRLEFKIQKSALPHLLGFHKLKSRKFNTRPEKIIEKIYKGTITLSDIRKDENFYMIKDRLLSVRLLFLVADKNIDTRLCNPSPKSRIMDLGIIDNTCHKNIVLGVGKGSDGYYYFKTLIINKKIHKGSNKIKVLRCGTERT